MKFTGTAKLTDDDLLEILRENQSVVIGTVLEHIKSAPASASVILDILGNKALTPMIVNFVRNKYGVTPRVTFTKNGITIIIDEGIPEVGLIKPTQRKAPSGFKRVFKGLYAEVGDIIDHLKAKKKHFLSFEDLLAELHESSDAKGNKKFVKNGKSLSMFTLKQRLAPSQIEKQSKVQPNLKGITVDKKKDGLSF